MQTAAHPMSMEFIVIIDVGATIILLSEVICPCFVMSSRIICLHMLQYAPIQILVVPRTSEGY
jgi:hypothetical protein